MARKKDGKRPPLRSSIACQRCRKSKIKCNNKGVSAPCETCIKNGKECIYPDATPAPPKRPEPPLAYKPEQNGSERKRLRKLDEVTRLDTQSSAALYAEEVLSAHYLSETMWSQIFDIYRLHFATELPFLHLATLKERMGTKLRAKQKDTSPEINLVLLGILTLTARFHATLVSYVTTMRTPQPAEPNKQRPAQANQDAAAASEYFANALTKALGGLRTSMNIGSVERVQAFLMLGLYEWSQARPNTGGLGAWMYVGVAIRMAQALGLGYGDRPDKGKNDFRARSAPAYAAMSRSQTLIAKEIRRRTMFSCFILDRLLGCGKERVSTIRSEDLQIQLPCSDISFDLSQDVHTGFLRPDADDQARLVTEASVLSCFVRLVDLWGEISKWSFAGGRFAEHLPPWDPGTTFNQLRVKLDSFYENLPEVFKWCTSNYYKHENYQASGAYVSLHMLGALARIMLHREYIPFIPIRCDRPIGPLDEPTFPAGDEPEGFWEESAEEIFCAAKDIVDLVEICRDKLPMSSLVLFAVWTAAHVGIYAVHFPHMDTRRHMPQVDDGDETSQSEPTGRIDCSTSGPTGVTFKTLNQMSLWLSMAGTYATYFQDMDRYYAKIKIDFDRYIAKGKSRSGVSIRYGGPGGGLEEWRKESSRIMSNGVLLPATDEERHHLFDGSDHSHSRDSTLERSSSVGPDNYRTEHLGTPRSTPSMGFSAINSSSVQQQQQHQHHLGSDVAPSEHRYEGSNLAPDQSTGSGWRSFHSAVFAPPPPLPPTTPHAPQQQQQQQQRAMSPSQGPYGAGPRMSTTATMAMAAAAMDEAQAQAQAQAQARAPSTPSALETPQLYSESNFAEYLATHQSASWNAVPLLHVGMLAHGAEDAAAWADGNLFWGMTGTDGIFYEQ